MCSQINHLISNVKRNRTHDKSLKIELLGMLRNITYNTLFRNRTQKIVKNRILYF